MADVIDTSVPTDSKGGSLSSLTNQLGIRRSLRRGGGGGGKDDFVPEWLKAIVSFAMTVITTPFQKRGNALQQETENQPEPEQTQTVTSDLEPAVGNDLDPPMQGSMASRGNEPRLDGGNAAEIPAETNVDLYNPANLPTFVTEADRSIPDPVTIGLEPRVPALGSSKDPVIQAVAEAMTGEPYQTAGVAIGRSSALYQTFMRSISAADAAWAAAKLSQFANDNPAERAPQPIPELQPPSHEMAAMMIQAKQLTQQVTR